MPLINGEKWACEACVRGHRVSTCQHHDRELQHIKKKGRPVSQCQHCRSLRKSRSAHTRCDCGEKMFKCAHLKTTHEGHTDSCCCNHGGRCTCCHKKEYSQLETVLESASPGSGPVRIKKPVPSRRRATVHAESMLSFDEHGNRKTTSKCARASQKFEPYQLNRQNSTYSLHSASPADSPGCDSPSSSSISFPERRQSKSEAASPLMIGSSRSLSELNAQLPQLDLGSTNSLWSGGKFDLYSGLSEIEQPMFSAGLSAPSIDWNQYDGLEFATKAAPDFAPSNYSQPQSYGGFDLGSSEQPPTLTTTTSTSGEPSEIDDWISNSFENLDGSRYRTSTIGTGFDVSQITQNLLNSSGDLSKLDYDQFKMMKAGTQFLPTPASLAGDDPVLAPTSASMGGFPQTLVDEDPNLWMGSADYCHGLPSSDYQLPLADSPDEYLMTTFWGPQ
ncbi:hypothetical protein GE09DRAFT_296693 [Coniochaeta sp. 2T2.1]|nr:hypothetical protein GE09DRAFT_296693 [Coniochaeta sp. 2T2.1]